MLKKKDPLHSHLTESNEEVSLFNCFYEFKIFKFPKSQSFLGEKRTSIQQNTCNKLKFISFHFTNRFNLPVPR